jgi:hypothetical protein
MCTHTHSLFSFPVFALDTALILINVPPHTRLRELDCAFHGYQANIDKCIYTYTTLTQLVCGAYKDDSQHLKIAPHIFIFIL